MFVIGIITMPHLWELPQERFGVINMKLDSPNHSITDISTVAEAIKKLPSSAKVLYWKWVREPFEKDVNNMYNGILMILIDPNNKDDYNVYEVIINPNDDDKEEVEKELIAFIKDRRYDLLATLQ